MRSGPATVLADQLAEDERRRVGREEQRQLGGLLGLAESLGRQLVVETGEELLVLHQRRREVRLVRDEVLGTSMTHYNHRLRCGIDIVGISNFVTFLKNTKSYRRDLRRVEYGDERDPEMREHLEQISPTTNAHKITKPMS